MKAHELIDLLNALDPLTEVRVGEQVEGGPYMNASVGGVFQSVKQERVIICANDDEVWMDEDWDQRKGDFREDLEALTILWPITT